MSTMDKYNEDPFRAGAARAFGKPFAEVTREERNRFKHGMFETLQSDTFLSWQADYVQEALRRQMEELAEEHGELEYADME